MKKLSLFALALALVASGALYLVPAQDAEARAPYDDPGDPDDPDSICWDAHLSVDTDNNGSYDLGWNVAVGESHANCFFQLGGMINTANANGWGYANAHCYSYQYPGDCPD